MSDPQPHEQPNLKDKSVRIWDASTGQSLARPLSHEGEVNHFAVSGDGLLVVTASDDGTARVWKTATGEPACPPLRHLDKVRHAAFSPDGRPVITASEDKTASVWDVESGKRLGLPLAHDSGVNAALISPDGRRFYTLTWDDEVVSRSVIGAVWFLSGKEVERDRFRRVNGLPPLRLSGSPFKGAMRSWDASLCRPLTAPISCESDGPSPSLSSGGRLLLATPVRRRAQVWDAATGEAVTPRLRHATDGNIVAAVFSPDAQSGRRPCRRKSGASSCCRSP
jgi:WD40 repeat protein